MSLRSRQSQFPATFLHATRVLTARRTLHNQNNSPLLKLPAELRNKIYHYVFSGHVISMARSPRVPKMQVYLNGGHFRTTVISQPHFLALTATCRQICNETYLVPFELSELRITAYSDFELETVQAFLDCLRTERRAAIASFCICSSFFSRYLSMHWSTQDWIGTKLESESDALEQERTKPFRTFLTQLNGLKCILVLGTTELGPDTDEKTVATRMEETSQECGRAGQWMQSLLGEGEVEVMVELWTEWSLVNS